MSRPVVRNIRNNDDKSRGGNKGRGAAQSKRSNAKSSDGRPSGRPADNRAPVKSKLDTGRKPKEEKAVSSIDL